LGLHAFGDERIRDEFLKIPVAIDAAEFHTYSVEWLPGEVRFFVDDDLVAAMDQSPDYPMQLMLNIYEFDSPATGDYPKTFEVDWVRGYRPLLDSSNLQA
jgi:beta-glucanase (GH16 family)